MLPGLEMMACTELAVPAEVMRHVVTVESSFNPYAIGVVGGRLARQPKNLAEALSTTRMLEREGYNFSLGLAQVNRHNLAKQGLDSYEKAFNVCPNLQAGSRILAECYGRAGNDWGKAFSCYYSGNFTTGYRHGYVDKVMASWRGATVASANGASSNGVIPVIRNRAPATNAAATGNGAGAPATRHYRVPVESTASRVLRRIEEAALSGIGGGDTGMSGLPSAGGSLPDAYRLPLPPVEPARRAATGGDDAPVIVQPMGAGRPSSQQPGSPTQAPAQRPAAPARDPALVF